MSIDLLVFIRFFLGGLFTYLFARRIGIGFYPGLFAGTAFILSYQMVMYGNSPELAPQILTPLLLYAFDHLALSPSLKSLTGTALIIAWIIISGLPEASFLALMMGGMWFIYRSIWRIVKEGDRFNKFMFGICWGVGAIVSGVALSAWYWIPLVENISVSVTKHGIGRGSQTVANQVPIVLSMLPPLDTVSGTPYYHLVVITLAIATLLALPWLGKKLETSAFFLGYCLIFGLGIYNIPPFNLIGYLPGYNQIILPHYLVSTITISLILFAAIGVEFFSQSVNKIALLILACLIQVAVLGFFFGLNQITVNNSHHRILTSLNIASIIFLGVIGITLLLIIIKKPQYISILLLLLSFAEVLIIHRNLQHPNRYNPYIEPPYVTYLHSVKDPYRLIGFDGTLMADISMAYGIDDMRYLEAIEPIRRQMFMSTLVVPNKALDRITGWESPFYMGRILDLLNIRYLLSPGDVPKKYKLIYDHEIKIYENSEVLPRAFILFSIKQVKDANQAVKTLSDPEFDPTTMAVIEEEFWSNSLQNLTQPVLEKWKSAQIVESDPNCMIIKTDSSKPGVLVVSDTYFPGWKSTLDNQPTQIFPTDGLFRGIYLPSGKHQVLFRYQPALFMIGLIIAVGISFLLLAFWGFKIYRLSFPGNQ